MQLTVHGGRLLNPDQTTFKYQLDEIQRPRAQSWPLNTTAPAQPADSVQQVLRGGYPEMLQRGTPARRQAWARAYMTTLLERDIQDIAQIEQLSQIPQRLSIDAELSGQLVADPAHAIWCNTGNLGLRRTAPAA
jgi:predicted AAA+ superfamily ATPase